MTVVKCCSWGKVVHWKVSFVSQLCWSSVWLIFLFSRWWTEWSETNHFRMEMRRSPLWRRMRCVHFALMSSLITSIETLVQSEKRTLNGLLSPPNGLPESWFLTSLSLFSWLWTNIIIPKAMERILGHPFLQYTKTSNRFSASNPIVFATRRVQQTQIRIPIRTWKTTAKKWRTGRKARTEESYFIIVHTLWMNTRNYAVALGHSLAMRSSSDNCPVSSNNRPFMIHDSNHFLIWSFSIWKWVCHFSWILRRFPKVKWIIGKWENMESSSTFKTTMEDGSMPRIFRKLPRSSHGQRLSVSTASTKKRDTRNRFHRGWWETHSSQGISPQNVRWLTLIISIITCLSHCLTIDKFHCIKRTQFNVTHFKSPKVLHLAIGQVWRLLWLLLLVIFPVELERFSLSKLIFVQGLEKEEWVSSVESLRKWSHIHWCDVSFLD